MAGDYRIVLITKGDLFDQERKLAQSGLGDFFDAVEIVSEKTPETYQRIFTRHGDGADASHDDRQFAEVGRRAGDRGRQLGRACAA